MAPHGSARHRGRRFVRRWWAVAGLQLLQVRVTTNERGEPLWPRPLSPRGTFMLASGIASILIGVSYLIPSAAEVTTVEPVREVLPPAAFASLWILAGAAVIVLGPTSWWHYGIVAVAVMHSAWATTSLIAWHMDAAPRGWVLAVLYAHGAVSCFTNLRMVNPPRQETVRIPNAR